MSDDAESMLEIIGLMKQGEILSNKSVRQVSSLVGRLDQITVSQLTELTLIYSSAEMQSAVDISEDIGKLESALITRS